MKCAHMITLPNGDCTAIHYCAKDKEIPHFTHECMCGKLWLDHTHPEVDKVLRSLAGERNERLA